MVRHVSAQEARDKFGELIDSVRHTNQPVVVEKRGKAVAVVISPEDFDTYRAWRRDRAWAAIDELWALNADRDPDEIEREVAEEIAAYRREKREREALLQSRAE